MKLQGTTWVLLGVAVASIALVHADPWQEVESQPGYVSTRSAARRLFPALSEVELTSVRIDLETRRGHIALVPKSEGHVVVVDDAVIGPASPDAIEGLVASLRMATTLRGVAEDADIGGTQRGVLQVQLDDRVAVLTIGRETVDRVGFYGTLEDADTTTSWVIEPEVAKILDQQPEAWLARRLLTVDASAVLELAFADGAHLLRQNDGLWRATTESAHAIVSRDAVETKLDRLLSATLAPWQPQVPEGTPWLQVRSIGDRVDVVRTAGACPHEPDRVLVTRGLGWAGCLVAERLEPWPLPTQETPGPWIEPRLLPHAYGRVLRIEQDQPTSATLRRDGGDWRLETTSGTHQLGDAEVFGWYQDLHDAEVVAETLDCTENGCSPEPTQRWTLSTDAGTTLQLECTMTDERVLCRRDAGPWLHVRDPIPPLELSPATFAERILLAVDSLDVRSLEFVGPEVARQSVHFDFGVWRLDTPEHPDGDGALSDLALEALLATLASLRVERWVEVPSEAPIRTLVLDRFPVQDQPVRETVRLYRGCVAAVDDRAGVLPKSACQHLGADWIHGDPVVDWAQTARRIEMLQVGHERPTTWRRVGSALVVEDHDNTWARGSFETLSSVTDARLRSGTVSTPALGTLRILPARGPAFTATFGEHWLQLDGVDWHYVWSPEPTANGSDSVQ